jgi:lysophospholipase L1-like esterase
VINHAVGGRSSRSFVVLGQWASTVADLKKGDWLFIQFGHNDRDAADTTRYTDTADYKKYLGMYIDSARKLGVHPVLVTSMNMNTWTDTTKRIVREVFTEGANNYWAAMKHVGTAKNVPVLDLGHQSTLLMDTMGCGYMTKYHFMGLETGEYPNYPNGNVDGTHFQEEGAEENARMITEEIARQSTDSILAPLAAILAKRYASRVSTNLSSGGVVTHSRVFPPGATATLKVRVAS